MRQGKQQDVGGTMHIEIVQNHVDWLGLLWDPGVDTLQKVDPIGNGPSGVGLRKSLARDRTKCSEDVALPTSAIIDLLTSTLGRERWLGGRGHAHELLLREALGRFRTHLIQADHDTPCRRVRIEYLNTPLFLANSRSTRSQTRSLACASGGLRQAASRQSDSA